jgi:hypothetical protein
VPTKVVPFRPVPLNVGNRTPSVSRPKVQRNSTVSSIQDLLKGHGYDSRIIHISKSQLPLLAEVQDQGTTKLFRIVDIQQDKETSSRLAPKFILKTVENNGHNDGDGTTQTVDIGQITTIWYSKNSERIQATASRDNISERLLMNASQVHELLERLYKAKVGQGRSNDNSKHHGLTKKQIHKLALQVTTEINPDLVLTLLRQIVKTGPNYVRLVDSSSVLEQKSFSSPSLQQQQRILLAHILGDQNFNGGRFKRWPCLWIPCGDGEDGQITLVNGGWLVVDQSVRASNEGQMFVEQQTLSTQQESKTSALPATTSLTNGINKNAKTNPLIEERILHRLECLAMGEEPDGHDNNNNSRLEVDVRAALRALGLPPTSEGAREALVQMGRWAKDHSNHNLILPWSQRILQAAEWYHTFNKERKQHLYQQLQQMEVGQSTRESTHEYIEGRVDLTKLPCVCVDAVNTSFRDDAIGIRPRASTGRKVDPNASKWEILLHIADVSDIFADLHGLEDHKEHLLTLRSIAASRGTSRYDLPRGPLHMLPTNVLESLSFSVFKPDWTSVLSFSEQYQNDATSRSVNRCVTMWLYIDEESGKILDSGLDRTLISRPVALSFKSASALLTGTSPLPSNTNNLIKCNDDPMVSKIRAILKVAERNIQKWRDYRLSTSQYAQHREDRISSYEEMSRHVYGSTNRRDDGRDGFQRTRGHRLVDDSMDLYGYTLTKLIDKAQGSLPRVVGARDARVATAPLRRFIDGVAQRQALSILCGFGGNHMSKQECDMIGRQATESLNRISNFNTSKQKGKSSVISSTRVISKKQQQEAVRLLKIQAGNKLDKITLLPAISTGKGSEVLLMGIGAVATCRGIKGTLRPGSKVQVRLEKIDDQNGKIMTILVD